MFFILNPRPLIRYFNSLKVNIDNAPGVSVNHFGQKLFGNPYDSHQIDIKTFFAFMIKVPGFFEKSGSILKK
jgi:hypothetical protein